MSTQTQMMPNSRPLSSEGFAHLLFFAEGMPRPGGSKKAFYNKRLGRSMIVENNQKQNREWRDTVKASFRATHPGVVRLEGPLRLEVTFFMPRPKGHYGTGKNADNLKPSAPPVPTTKPDATKLLRSTEDALNGVAWGDDAQIVEQLVRKRYAEKGEPIGAAITIRRWGNE